MNLYKILIAHSAPKDRVEAIKTYLLANNEEEVFSFIDSKYTYDSWSDYEEKEFDVYDDDFNIVGTETYKEKIIRIKGDMNDEDYDYSDAHYGISTYGWELIEENTTFDYSKMIKLGIVEKIKNK